MKPREFWIQQYSSGELAVVSDNNKFKKPENSIHVIEYSAYEALKHTLDREVKSANHTFDKLTEQNKIMRKALEFVVNRENYAFAECSIAEEIWTKCKNALGSTEPITSSCKHYKDEKKPTKINGDSGFYFDEYGRKVLWSYYE
jgi:hypothetical protein